MYHPHCRRDGADGDGHDGHVHRASARPELHRVDRDFVFIMSPTPSIPAPRCRGSSEMTDFNMWTWNTRVFPGIDPLPVRLGDRVRVRIGNLTMTNHPIHLHGYRFEVTCTDGGWVPESARWPEATIDVPVGAMRAYRVRRRRAGRLGVSLPQVAPHHERDGPQHAKLDRRQAERDLTQGDPQASCRTTCRWARPAWPRWARWKCRCPTTRCR